MTRLATATRERNQPQHQRLSTPPAGVPDNGPARLQRMLQVVHGALAFAETHGYQNFDPADAKGTQIVLWTFTRGTLLSRLVRLAVYGGLYVAPIGFRKLLGVQPCRYAHASAMLACAYVELHKITAEDLWFRQARSLLEWLSENTAQAPVGECWGSPFPWFSYGGVVPSSVGSSHGTIWAANAFFTYHQATGDQWALDHCVRACDFLAYGLNSTNHPSGSLSVSYSVIDQSQCININADSASILVRLGKAIARPEYYEVGIKILRFVIENQNRDGSWNYDVPLPGPSPTNVDGRPWSPNIDGFHTGMVLSALAQLIPELGDGEQRAASVAALGRGLSFYMENLFTRNGTPLYALGKRYPIDAYSCGQAIITLVDACECESLDLALRRKAARLLDAVVDRTVDLMLDSNGSFLTARYRFRSFRLKCLRWAQAVLVLAFERYCGLLLKGLKAESSPN